MEDFYKLLRLFGNNLTDIVLEKYPEYKKDFQTMLTEYEYRCFYCISLKNRNNRIAMNADILHLKLEVNGNILEEKIGGHLNSEVANAIVADLSAMAKQKLPELQEKVSSYFIENLEAVQKQWIELDKLTDLIGHYEDALYLELPSWLRNKHMTLTARNLHYKSTRILTLSNEIEFERGIGYLWNFLKKKDRNLTLSQCIINLQECFQTIMQTDVYKEVFKLDQEYKKNAKKFKEDFGFDWVSYSNIETFISRLNNYV